VPVVHAAFQLMVASGFALAGTAVWGAWRRWRHRDRWLQSRLFLRVLMLIAPLGVVAMEAGWVVTEVGRQPWIINGIMKTADAVTPMPGLIVPFIVFTALYMVLGAIVVLLIAQEVRAIPADTTRDPRNTEHRHAVA
jgi:cytochrome d ubiquinol oxidase subunit I